MSVAGVAGHINSKVDTDAGVLHSLTIDRLVAFTRLAAKDGDYAAESFKRVFELDECKSAEGDVHMLLKVDSLQGDGASDVTATATGIGVRKGEILGSNLIKTVATLKYWTGFLWFNTAAAVCVLVAHCR